MNGNMDLGRVSFWNKYGRSGAFDDDVVGYIRYNGRKSRWNGPQYEARQLLDYRCLTVGRTFNIHARIKLFAAGSNMGAMCDLTSTSSATGCPQFRIFLYNKTNTRRAHTIFKLRTYASETWDPNGFNQLQDTFTIPEINGIGKVLIILRDFNEKLDVAVDDFSIHPAD